MVLREGHEFRTLTLIILCYGLWGFILFGLTAMPVWLVILLLVPLITFHSSLQHECIHGHPFADSRLNDLIAFLPIGIFMPYPRFKENHLNHHQRARISDPEEDPESWYVTRRKWRGMSRLHKWLRRTNNTLIGRLLMGPAISAGVLIATDAKKVKSGDRRLLSVWLIHLAICLALLNIIDAFGSVTVLGYLVAAYFGMSLLMIRTFLEHQAHCDRRARSVLINDKGILSFLFLNNNLHAVHHAFPSVAWYRLPSLFRLHRERFMEMNKGYFFRNYADVIRRYAFSSKEPVAFPLDPV